MKNASIYRFMVFSMIVSSASWALAGQGGASAGGGFSSVSLASANQSFLNRNIIWRYDSSTVFVAIGLIAGIICMNLIFRFDRNRRRAAKILYESQDDFWSKDSLQQKVAMAFCEIQTGWSNNNLSSIKHLLSDELYTQWEFQLASMNSAGQKNMISSCSVQEVELVVIRDFTDNKKDEFIAEITFCANDLKIHPKSCDNNEISSGLEYWRFKRYGHIIKLSERIGSGNSGKLIVGLDSTIKE